MVLVPHYGPYVPRSPLVQADLVLTTEGKALTQLHTWKLSNRGTVQMPSPTHSRLWRATDVNRGSAEAEVRVGRAQEGARS